MDSPLIAAGDFDLFQVGIIALFVIGGFIKWLWENRQLSHEADQRNAPVEAEEQRLRDEAWRKQTGQGQRPVPPPIPTSSSWDELRKAWNELKDAARSGQAPAPAARPPVRPSQTPKQPPPPRRGSVREAVTPAPAKPAAAVPAVLADSAPAAPGVEHRPASSLLSTLQNLRHDPALLRQAILMQEILGPPKALQSSTEPAI